jgi:hypothetical protein
MEEALTKLDQGRLHEEGWFSQKLIFCDREYLDFIFVLQSRKRSSTFTIYLACHVVRLLNFRYLRAMTNSCLSLLRPSDYYYQIVV